MKQENNYSKDFRTRSALALIITVPFWLLTNSVSADDTEIFTAYTPTTTESNVVFVIDTSRSMGDAPLNAPADSPAKMDIVKSVFEQLIFDKDGNGAPDHTKPNPKLSGLNLALMRFDQSDAHGGYFLSDMKKLNNGSFKDQLWTSVNGLTAQGSTPLAETAYEAALYFQGGEPLFGAASTPGTNDPAITANGVYKSPFSDPQALQAQCSINNHLVILTDGKPTSDEEADTAIQALPHTSTCGFDDTNYTADCLPMVAKYLHDEDFLPNTPGHQNVMTHTIAFDLQEANAVELLRQTSEVNGGGMATNANNASELSVALSNILTQVIDKATSFVSPAVSISDSDFVHDNTVYFGMFKPEITPLWTGNLKGYQLSSSGQLMDFSSPPIPALTNTGDIATGAKSKWSNAIDGDEVTAGGAAQVLLSQASRNILTQNSSSPSSHALVAFTAANVANADLNVATDSEKQALIDWASHRASNPIGDPLHSTPQVVKYNNSDSYIFFGTNQGFLHVIDAAPESGHEKFAFIPKALLGNLKTFKNNFSSSDHPYGLDGPISVYRKDGNNDGNITTDPSANDLVLIIVGMRRGGNSYYAINATDINNPTLQWQITGGSGDFTALGQTWAKPIVVDMHFGSTSGNSQPVVLLTGGYDPQYDALSPDPTTPKGNAIYAVDLLTGNRVWSATGGDASASTTQLTIPELTDAIPADVSAIDTNSDGMVDRLYAIDIMGRIFRIDFNNSVSNEYVPNGKMFANLGGASRRFYYSVDVAYTTTGYTPKLHLSVGSGHRAHPLATDSQDRFFSVWDTHVKTALPNDFTPITVADLTDVSTLNNDTTIGQSGWYFSVPAGEKVLSEASSMSGYVFFTTYIPPVASPTPSCTPPTGSGNLYAVQLNDSSALSNTRAIPLHYTGIPPAPTFMSLATSDSGNNTDPYANTDVHRVVLVGGVDPLSEEDELKFNTSDTSKTYWHM